MPRGGKRPNAGRRPKNPQQTRAAKPRAPRKSKPAPQSKQSNAESKPDQPTITAALSAPAPVAPPMPPSGEPGFASGAPDERPRTPNVIADADALPTEARKAVFLAHYARTGNVLRSCQLLGIGRSTVYGAWIHDPGFKAAFEQANEDATDLLEEEARRRAIDGVLEPVFYQGVESGYVRKYSDSLLMFVLRAKRDSFREKRTVGVGVESGGSGGVRKVIVEIDESPGASA